MLNPFRIEDINSNLTCELKLTTVFKWKFEFKFKIVFKRLKARFEHLDLILMVHVCSLLVSALKLDYWNWTRTLTHGYQFLKECEEHGKLLQEWTEYIYACIRVRIYTNGEENVLKEVSMVSTV